jgi:hypothetical protein
MTFRPRSSLAGAVALSAAIGLVAWTRLAAAQVVVFAENLDGPWLTANHDLQTPPFGYWTSIGAGDMVCHRSGYFVGWSSGLGQYSPPGALGTPQSASWNTRNAPTGAIGSIQSPFFPIQPFPGPKALTFYKIGTDSLRVSITQDGVNFIPVLAVGTVPTWTRFDVNLGASAFPMMSVRFEAVARHGPVNVGVDQIAVIATNRPPVVQPIADAQAPEDQLLTVAPSANDPDGDGITWSGTSLPRGAHVDPGSGTLSWTACLDQEGHYPGVTLIATDPWGASGSTSFDITITHPDTTQYGSCAFSDGTCLTLTAAQCSAENGHYLGDGNYCADGADAQDKEKWIVIPVKINVLKPIEFSADKAKEMIEAANKILKQAKIKLEFDPKNLQSGVSDGGAGAEKDDGKIAEGEEGGLFKNGADELKKKAADGGFDGKGFKIYITTAFGASPARQGYNQHKQPVGMVRNLESSTMGEILAHEFSHAMTLSKKAPYNDRGDQSDKDGHVDDADNLMYPEPGHVAAPGVPKLEGPQIKEITKPENAGARGDVKEMKAGQGPQERVAAAALVLERLEVRSGLWTDAADDTVHDGLDLAFGQLVVDDPVENLAARIGVAGFLPDSTDTLSYQVAFDTDHRPDTGIPWGSYTGIDKVLDVRASGRSPYSFARDNLHARLLDAATGGWACLPAGAVTHEYGISDVDSTGVPSAEPVGDMIEQPIRFDALGLTATTVTYGVRAELRNAGGLVAFDESPVAELLLAPTGPNLDMAPLTATPGDTTTLTGSGYSPMSPISVFLDDSLLTSTTANVTGAFTLPLVVPPLVNSSYFVTARDTTGGFDFSVLIVTGGAVGRDGPLPPPARLAVERNPFQRTVGFSLPGEGRGTITIHDVAGRVVRRLDVRAEGAGSRRLVWDGRRADGLEAPSGVYFVRLTRGSLRASAHVIKVQ